MGKNDKAGDSYCGIYCGACDISMADKTGRKTVFAEFWSEPMVTSFLRSQGYRRQEGESLRLQCSGCKSDNLFINCRVCPIRTCARERNVARCNDCKDYPCRILTERKKVEGLLPHVKSCQDNLEAIKKNGVDAWLADQGKRWKCPECQTGFAWYSAKCASCGRDLKEHAFRFSFLQSLFLKLGLRLAALKGGR